jgi:choloylglycine hydrolase
VAPLHWIISDSKESITVESNSEGLSVYQNEVGVLTNSPSWPMQIFNLNNYASLTPKQPNNSFSKKLSLQNYSYGLGALGLPGDLSSMSRFVRAVYYKYNITADGSPQSDFFRVINTCFQPKGLTETEEERFEYTAYTSCCDATKGIYGFKTYNDETLKQINMHDFDLNGNVLYV